MKIECNNDSGRAWRFVKYMKKATWEKSLNYLLSTISNIRHELNTQDTATNTNRSKEGNQK